MEAVFAKADHPVNPSKDIQLTGRIKSDLFPCRSNVSIIPRTSGTGAPKHIRHTLDKECGTIPPLPLIIDLLTYLPHLLLLFYVIDSRRVFIKEYTAFDFSVGE